MCRANRFLCETKGNESRDRKKRGEWKRNEEKHIEFRKTFKAPRLLFSACWRVAWNAIPRDVLVMRWGREGVEEERAKTWEGVEEEGERGGGLWRKNLVTGRLSATKEQVGTGLKTLHSQRSTSGDLSASQSHVTLDGHVRKQKQTSVKQLTVPNWSILSVQDQEGV